MKRNVVEWSVLAVSIAAIVLLVAVLVVEGLSEGRPADPTVSLGTAEARQGSLGWIVPATVANSGDEPMEGVVLEASATVAGAQETSELQVDFLPAGTEVEIAFAFSGQPTDEVSVRLVGYRVP